MKDLIICINICSVIKRKIKKVLVKKVKITEILKINLDNLIENYKVLVVLALVKLIYVLVQEHTLNVIYLVTNKEINWLAIY